MYYCRSKHSVFLDIMLSNVLNRFSKTSAYFGFLKFIYTERTDKNANDKNDRLSSVSHYDLYAVYSSSSKGALILTRLLIFNPLNLYINFSQMKKRRFFFNQLTEVNQNNRC